MQQSLLLVLIALPLGLATEPKYCSSVKKPCTSVQKSQCFCSCPDEPDPIRCKTEETAHKKGKRETLQLAAINDDMTQIQKMRVARSKATKKMWPLCCQGRNAKGEQLSLSTDGFICTGIEESTIPSIVNPIWMHPEPSFLCCQGQCKEKYACANSKSLNLAEAAKVSSDAVHELHTVSGQVVKLNKIENSEEEIVATGVVSTLEIRMLGDTLAFKSARAELTPESEDFIGELGGPLETLLTMQLTASQHKFPGGVHFLFCPHGSTASTLENINPKYALIPQQRAEKVRDVLEAELPSGGVASVGEAFGHHAKEVEGFEGGRFGSIIYKVHDTSRPPVCNKEDIYPFVKSDKPTDVIIV